MVAAQHARSMKRSVGRSRDGIVGVGTWRWQFGPSHFAIGTAGISESPVAARRLAMPCSPPVIT